MNSKERVNNALSGKAIDRLPMWYGAEPATITDGNAFILYFTVSSNAQPGTYPVKLSYTSGYDSGLNSVDMNVIEGSIVVSG